MRISTVNISDTEYKDFGIIEWIMLWIEMYGQIDGAHHKQWLIDQIARIAKGTPVIVTLAKWDNGEEEHRFNLGLSSDQYHQWVVAMKDGEDGPDTYDYDEGIAP